MVSNFGACHYTNRNQLLLVNYFSQQMQIISSMPKALNSCILLICSTGMCLEYGEDGFISSDEKTLRRWLGG